MSAEVAKRLVNVEEYYKMAEVGILQPSDHVELIRGEIYTMSPIGSKHAGIVKRLTKLLNDLFRDEVILGVQDPIRLSDENEPEPDISILKYREDYYINGHPTPKDILAIIEVADSSIKYDKEVKIPLYASHGIPVYWIVDIENDMIEVLSNPIEGSYNEKKVYSSGDVLTLLGKRLQFKDIIILNNPQD